MNDWIKQYIVIVRHLFPIMGKPERAYLKHLGDNMKDFFEEHPPDSMETVISKFGPPEAVVNDYLVSAESDYLLKRMKQAKRWRLLAACLLVILLAAAVFFAYRLYLECNSYSQTIDEVLGYFIETIE